MFPRCYTNIGIAELDFELWLPGTLGSSPTSWTLTWSCCCACALDIFDVLTFTPQEMSLLPEALSPLSPSLSSSSLSPFLFPFVGWCDRLPYCLPLCPFLFSFVGWCVRLPEALSPSLSPSLSPVLSSSLSPSLSSFLSLCWMVCSP